MGASSWSYIVPYQPNIEVALQELRQRVFEKGVYYTPAAFLERVLGEQPESQQAELKKLIQELKSLPPPKSIEELVERNESEGTHSIIDIERISAEPDFGVAWPLSREELLGVFGTDQPIREMVEEKVAAGVLYQLRHRDEGLYLVIYKDGQPSEILFCGYSGD